MLALTSEALIQSPWLRASPLPVLFESACLALGWHQITASTVIQIHPTSNIPCLMSPNDSWSGTNHSASFGVLQCLWQLPQVTHPSHKRLPPNVLSSAAMPWPNRLCSFGFHGRWCSNLLRFRGELREAGTCWSCDICDSGPWFSGVLACGSTCSIWVLFTTAWKGPYQISVYEPTCDTNQGGCKEAATEFQQDPDCGRLRSLFWLRVGFFFGISALMIALV